MAEEVNSGLDVDTANTTEPMANEHADKSLGQFLAEEPDYTSLRKSEKLALAVRGAGRRMPLSNTVLLMALWSTFRLETHHLFMAWLVVFLVEKWADGTPFNDWF